MYVLCASMSRNNLARARKLSASKARAKVLLIEEKGFALPVQVLKKSLSDTTEQYSMIVERFK